MARLADMMGEVGKTIAIMDLGPLVFGQCRIVAQALREYETWNAVGRQLCEILDAALDPDKKEGD